MSKVYLVELRFKFKYGTQCNYSFFEDEQSAYNCFLKTIKTVSKRSYSTIQTTKPLLFMAVYDGELEYTGFKQYEAMDFNIDPEDYKNPDFNMGNLYFPYMDARYNEFKRVQSLDFGALTEIQFKSVNKNYGYYSVFDKSE